MHCKIFAKNHEEIISMCACNLHCIGMSEFLVNVFYCITIEQSRSEKGDKDPTTNCRI